MSQVKSYEIVSTKIKDVFMELYGNMQIHEITVKMICEKVGIARTSFYKYFSDVYEVLEHIEDTLISDLEEMNRTFALQDFHRCRCESFTYFYNTLSYIKEHEKWFRVLLNKSRDGQFIYKWKKIMKTDFRAK